MQVVPCTDRLLQLQLGNALAASANERRVSMPCQCLHDATSAGKASQEARPYKQQALAHELEGWWQKSLSHCVMETCADVSPRSHANTCCLLGPACHLQSGYTTCSSSPQAPQSVLCAGGATAGSEAHGLPVRHVLLGSAQRDGRLSWVRCCTTFSPGTWSKATPCAWPWVVCACMDCSIACQPGDVLWPTSQVYQETKSHDACKIAAPCSMLQNTQHVLIPVVPLQACRSVSGQQRCQPTLRPRSDSWSRMCMETTASCSSNKASADISWVACTMLER